MRVWICINWYAFNWHTLGLYTECHEWKCWIDLIVPARLLYKSQQLEFEKSILSNQLHNANKIKERKEMVESIKNIFHIQTHPRSNSVMDVLHHKWHMTEVCVVTCTCTGPPRTVNEWSVIHKWIPLGCDRYRSGLFTSNHMRKPQVHKSH